MKVVPVYEAKNRFSEPLVATELGEVISLTRGGGSVGAVSMRAIRDCPGAAH